MKSAVGHIQYNIDAKNIQFYKDLLVNFFGWKVICDETAILGIEDIHRTSLWFTAPAKKVANDYDGPGVNHLGIGVADQDNVDQAVAYIKKHGISPLFDTPRHRPEFCSDENSTYYQVMFETPDKLLFEVVYTGSKEK